MVPLVVTTIGTLCTVLITYLLYLGYLQNPTLVTFFESLLRIEGVAGSEIIVLGVGYSIAMCVQTSILLALVMRTFSIPGAWIFPSIARALIASILGGFAAYLTLNIFATGINDTAFLGILIQGASGGFVGIGVIIVMYHFLRSPELHEIYKSFHRRIFKTDIVASEVDVL
jgi:hypothetical protein